MNKLDLQTCSRKGTRSYVGDLLYWGLAPLLCVCRFLDCNSHRVTLTCCVSGFCYHWKPTNRLVVNIVLSEISQTEKDKHYHVTYTWDLKKQYKWMYMQNRNRLTDRITQSLWKRRGKGEGQIRGMGWRDTNYCV